MRIRHKVLLIVLTSAVLVLCTLSILSKQLVGSRFGEQETIASTAAFQQSRNWLNNLSHSRLVLANDWGSWDDLYNQVDSPTVEFRKESIAPTDLVKIEVSLFILLDTNGNVVENICPYFSNAICPNTWVKQMQSLVPSWVQNAHPETSGIVSLDSQCFAMGIATVKPHSYDATRNGFVIMARHIDAMQIPVPGGLGRVELHPSIGQPNQLHLQAVDLDSLVGSEVVEGITGFSGAELWAKTPRVFYREGKQALLYLTLWMLGLGGLIALALLIFLRKSVVERIEALAHDLSRVGAEGQASRVRVLGNDDIGDLCRQVNTTLEQLDNTRFDFEMQRTFDMETGIPNRNHFLSMLTDRIEREAFEKKGSFAMILISLNRFQRIYDTYGGSAGRELLIETSERLRMIPKIGYMARVSNAEFAIIVEDTDQISIVTHLSTTIRKSLEQPYILGSQKREVSLHVCIGISMAHDMENLSAHEVLRRADAALHNLEREDAISSVALFDPELDRRARELMDLEKDLRRALENNEFAIAYQPIFHLASGHVAGFESLIRWKHPEKGMISPAQFIPLAEETGLIESIGEWVLRESCRQLVEWSAQYPLIAQTFLSVNLSVRQFRDPNLISKIWHAVQSSGFPFERLKLEITESAMMDDPQDCARRLKSLTDLGIRLSLDDFGTGFSSLGYLDRFPVNTIKLDKSFIDKLLINSNSPIVRSVTILSNVMGYDLVAEGVEKQCQADALLQMGCGYVQGYLFAKPMLAEFAQSWLHDLPQPLELPLQ